MLTRVGIVCISVCVIGWIFAVMACTMPMWRWYDYLDRDKIRVEGLWKACQGPTTDQMTCRDHMSPQHSELRAARGMMIGSILVGVLGFMFAFVGVKLVDEDALRAKYMIISSVKFIVSGILVLVPVSWSAYGIEENPWIHLHIYGMERVPVHCLLGASLYIGWISAALLIFGGIVLYKMESTNLNSARVAARQNRNAVV